MGSKLKVTFERFLLLYLVLYIFPYGFEYIVELRPDDISFWTSITTWFGEVFLGWEYNMERLMKGFDSKYDYTRFLLIAVLSIFGALLWNVLSKRFKFLALNAKTWIITIVRYHLGLTLILYGMAKVLMLQFGEMDLLNLEDQVGSYTGMGFLWKFMSYSAFYTKMTGYVEVIAGILLLFRGTTFLGGIIAFIAMVNVVIIDIGYDVSVKMFAIHLLLMSTILIAYDIKRILRFVVFNQAVEGASYASLFSPKQQKIKYALKGAILLYFTISQFYFLQGRLEREKPVNQYPELTKIYQVQKQSINGKDLDSIKGMDDKKWKSVIINGSSRLNNTMVIRRDNRRSLYFSTKMDTIAKTITFYRYRGDENDSYVFKYEDLGDKLYKFEGVYKKDTISLTTKSKSKEDYRLMRNKFKWIRDLK